MYRSIADARRLVLLLGINFDMGSADEPRVFRCAQDIMAISPIPNSRVKSAILRKFILENCSSATG